MRIIGISRKTFVNKAAFPSHVLKRSLHFQGKCAQICSLLILEVSAIGEETVALFYIYL